MCRRTQRAELSPETNSAGIRERRAIVHIAPATAPGNRRAATLSQLTYTSITHPARIED